MRIREICRTIGCSKARKSKFEIGMNIGRAGLVSRVAEVDLTGMAPAAVGWGKLAKLSPLIALAHIQTLSAPRRLPGRLLLVGTLICLAAALGPPWPAGNANLAAQSIVAVPVLT